MLSHFRISDGYDAEVVWAENRWRRSDRRNHFQKFRKNWPVPLRVVAERCTHCRGYVASHQTRLWMEKEASRDLFAGFTWRDWGKSWNVWEYTAPAKIRTWCFRSMTETCHHSVPVINDWTVQNIPLKICSWKICWIKVRTCVMVHPFLRELQGTPWCAWIARVRCCLTVDQRKLVRYSQPCA